MTAQNVDNITRLVENGGYRVNIEDEVFASGDYDFPVGVLENKSVRIPYASHPAQISDADRFREFCERNDIPFVEQASHQFVVNDIKKHAERFNAIVRRLDK